VEEWKNGCAGEGGKMWRKFKIRKSIMREWNKKAGKEEAWRSKEE